jgi:ABC-type multidrug transport system ATPase subunit
MTVVATATASGFNDSTQVAAVSSRGVRVDVDDVSRRVRRRGGDATRLLDAVSFSISPGELVAIVGPSGAGKTSLLEVMAGIASPASGAVHFDGADLHTHRSAFRGQLGYVPQDDIIHADLTVGRTVRYAARLRLPSSTDAATVDAAVERALVSVGLGERADARVGSLSGGERKRASIAVELLTDPRIFFLDEPTSGLDPITGGDVIKHLRDLADGFATVVFTTHAVEDLDMCDRVVFMARGGRAAFVGTVDEALARFDVDSVAELYRCLSDPDVEPAAGSTQPQLPPRADRDFVVRPVAGWITQWLVLSRRALETVTRNRLTVTILLGSPALVVGMFAILFRPGAFDVAHPSPSSMVMIGFWIVFAAFFFGLTYGLLQICTERTIVQRESLVGLRMSAYVASKVTILVPFLAVVVVAMLGLLRALDRLPARPAATYASMGVGLMLCALAALGLGLLTSAAVGNTAQATLALPMLCFPAVLFSGAILPVNLMAQAGAWISTAVPSRWAFEEIGHDLGARRILARGGSQLGPPLLESYGDAGTRATPMYWLILAAFACMFLVATWAVLVHSTRRSQR